MFSKNNKTIFAVTASSFIIWAVFFLFVEQTSLLKEYFFEEIDSNFANALSHISFGWYGFIFGIMGAVFLGILSDSGRRICVLLYSNFSIGTFGLMVALIPTASKMGIFTPVVFCILSMIWHFFLGVNLVNSAIYVSELEADEGRKTNFNLILASPIIGYALSMLLVILVKNTDKFGFTTDFFSGFPVDNFTKDFGGWRIPFYISALLILISIYYYYSIPKKDRLELTKFQKLVNIVIDRIFKINVKGNHNSSFFTMLFTFTCISSMYCLIDNYLVNYLSSSCNIKIEDVKLILIIAVFISIPFFPFFGWVSTKIGEKCVLVFGFFISLVIFTFILSDIKSITQIDTNTELIDLREQYIKHKKDAEEGHIIKKTTTINKYEKGSVRKTIQLDTLLNKEDYNGAKLDKNPLVEIEVGNALKWKLIALVCLPIILLSIIAAPVTTLFKELYYPNVRVYVGSILFLTSVIFPFVFFNHIVKYLIENKVVMPEKEHIVYAWFFVIIFSLALFFSICGFRNKNQIA